jgi:phosphoserine phosphatase
MSTNLIIQGQAQSADLEAIAGLSGAAGMDTLSPTAWRLRYAKRRDGVAEYCGRSALDCAFVPAGQKLADFGLVAMDMDSTLITIECIDEIAALMGVGEQVATITASAMRGDIDFKESLLQRVALLAGLKESELQRIYDERLRLSPGAETMIAKLKSLGIRTLLVSGGFSFFTDRLQQRLGLDYTLSNTFEVEKGKLTGRVYGSIIGARAKADELVRCARELGLSRDRMIAIGDGANDLPMMAAAGISVAYHAKPVVREKATYCLDHVGLDGLLNLFA